jgi:hypothetical protein
MFRYSDGLTGIIGVSLLVLTSCAPGNYAQNFQVASVKSPTLQASDEGLIHRNNDLTLTYTFWEKGGEMAYIIQNKSDEIIYIDLKRSFFIKNGAANTYYIDKKRTSTELSGEAEKEEYEFLGVEQEEASYESSSTSVEVANKAKIAIPPKSHKSISRFSLTTSVFDYCGLDQGFSNFEELTHTKEFDRQSSPLIFENYLKYSFDKDLEEVKTIRNAFYVSKVENVKSEDFFREKEVETRCNPTVTKQVTVEPYSAEFKFYNTYEVR